MLCDNQSTLWCDRITWLTNWWTHLFLLKLSQTLFHLSTSRNLSTEWKEKSRKRSATALDFWRLKFTPSPSQQTRAYTNLVGTTSFLFPRLRLSSFYHCVVIIFSFFFLFSFTLTFRLSYLHNAHSVLQVPSQPKRDSRKVTELE